MYNKGSNDVTDERTRRSLGFKQETNPKWKLLTQPALNDTFQVVWEVGFFKSFVNL